MTTQINQHTLVEYLRAAFPDLEEDYQDRVRKAGEELPSSNEVVGFVLKPRLKKELARGTITEFVRRSAAFIEKVVVSGDIEAQNIIWIKIFEWLITDPKNLALLWPVLGKRTKRMIKDAARRWGYTSNLP